MEDAIQIIFFIIFFIFSILSSKKKNKKKKSNVPVQPAKAKKNQSSQTKTQQEIFEELFGLKQKPEVPPVDVITETQKTKENVYKTWYAEDDFKKTKHNDNYSFKEKVQKTKEQLEKEKLEHEALKQVSKSPKIVAQNKYQKLLLNPTTLKDFIVISEILNKPKALRR